MSFRRFVIGASLALSFALAAPAALAQISVTTLGTPFPENFDTLPASGSTTWTNNSTIPGWFHQRTGTGTTIVANNGSSNAGNLYSYGTGTATDRALGSVGSGNAAVGNLFWGVRLQNNTGATITQLDVAYTGEQWRNSAAAAQTISFSYLVGSPIVTGTLAEFQSAGVAVPALGFTSPITGGTAGARDGNLAANRVVITQSITGLSIPNGTEVMLRWSDPDHTGADHGLSIDDFSVTAQGAGGTSADLAIAKTDNPDPIVAGNNLTYTITLTNNGPNDAQTVTLSDVVPAGTTFVSFGQTAGPAFVIAPNPPVGGTGTVSASIATLANGASATFSLVVNVDANQASGSTITNTVDTTSATTDPNSANNSDTETTSVSASADLSVTKTDSPDPVVAGNTITYTIDAANGGPSDAQSVTLTDAVPVGTTFVSFAQSAGSAFVVAPNPPVGGAGTVTATRLTLAAGDTAQFTLVVQVAAGAANGSTITNTATIASTTTDADPTDNSDTETTTVQGGVDLSVTKTDAPDPVTPGGTLTYTIAVANAGPTAAANVALSDAVPAGTTFVSFTAPAGWTSTTPPSGGTGTVTATNPSLASGANETFTLVVQVAPGAAGGSTITNTASVSTTSTDNDPANDSDTETTTVSSPSALTATKTASGPRTTGSTLTYTVGITNNGSSAQGDNPGDEFVDVLPAGLTLQSATATSGTVIATTGTNTVTWNGAIAAGASVTITIQATIDAGPGQSVVNQGTVNFDADGNGTNESSVQTDDPAAPGGADPTGIIVLAPIAVPAASPAALLLLLAAMLLLAAVAVRRRAT